PCPRARERAAAGGRTRRRSGRSRSSPRSRARSRPCGWRAAWADRRAAACRGEPRIIQTAHGDGTTARAPPAPQAAPRAPEGAPPRAVEGAPPRPAAEDVAVRLRASVRRGRGHPPAPPVPGPRATPRPRRPPGGPPAALRGSGRGVPPPTPLYDGARRTWPGGAAGPPSERLCAGTFARSGTPARPAQRSGEGGPAAPPRTVRGVTPPSGARRR